jgi:hypothetical protein
MEKSLNPADASKDARLNTTVPGASRGGHAHPPDRDYEVGYGKPPKETRFKKGQSGNPKNRARRAKTQGKVLSRVLDETVSVTENGRRRKILKIEAMLKQTVNRAAQGDRKATQAVLRMIGTNYRGYPKPGSKTASHARDPGVLMILPGKAYDLAHDPELKRRLVRTARDRQIEQQRMQNPGNDNYDDSVWKLKKR